MPKRISSSGSSRSGMRLTVSNPCCVLNSVMIRALLPIAGLVAFYNEKVDITLDGQPIPRPVTHFS